MAEDFDVEDAEGECARKWGGQGRLPCQHSCAVLEGDSSPSPPPSSDRSAGPSSLHPLLLLPTAGQFPGLAEARRHLVALEQQAGEALFVPSGWRHDVLNLDDCLSINHNWINGHNVHWAWALLRLERRQAEAGIEDCRALCRRVRRLAFCSHPL